MTILLLETLHPDAEAVLTETARLVRVEDADQAIVTAQQEGVWAIITRGRGQVRLPLLRASADLRVVARAGVGLDNVDVASATDLGIPVINSPGSTTIAVAEQTMLLTSALVRGLYSSVAAVRSGDWESRRSYSGDDLAGKRIGLMGMGQIAQRVARIAQAYDMEVAYSSRSDKDVPYRRLSLQELLRTSDVLSLHVALTPETRHLIGASELSEMKPGAYLVNTARGAIVDQAALLRALDDGSLAGFGADVLDPEPPDPADPILAHPRTLITPHTSALTGSTFRAMCIRTARNVVALLSGRPVEPDCIANEAGLKRADARNVGGG